MAELVLVAVLLLASGCAWWLLRDLRTVPSESGPPGRTVSVVVPARDEERTLPTLLRSLQHVSGVAEVVVVDDGSQDATAAVARAAGAQVLPAGTPPPGWTGKAWACDVGVRASRGELLLFLDADVALAPGAVDGLLALYVRHGGLVSVQPFHAVERPHEQLSAYFNVVSLLASAAFTRHPRGRPMAFGPCLLTSRADYERAGGHAEVRGEILDDVRLAAAYDRAGLPVRCAVGGASLRMRSYPAGIRQLADGWTKNIASGATAAAPGPAVATVLWVSAHHAVAVGTLLVLLNAFVGVGGSLVLGHPTVWLAAYVVAALQLRSILHAVGAFRWWAWALFPVPLLAFDAVFARSAVLTLVRRSVRWRGREVRLKGRAEEGA